MRASCLQARTFPTTLFLVLPFHVPLNWKRIPVDPDNNKWRTTSAHGGSDPGLCHRKMIVDVHLSRFTANQSVGSEFLEKPAPDSCGSPSSCLPTPPPSSDPTYGKAPPLQAPSTSEDSTQSFIFGIEK